MKSTRFLYMHFLFKCHKKVISDKMVVFNCTSTTIKCYERCAYCSILNFVLVILKASFMWSRQPSSLNGAKYTMSIFLFFYLRADNVYDFTLTSDYFIKIVNGIARALKSDLFKRNTNRIDSFNSPIEMCPSRIKWCPLP